MTSQKFKTIFSILYDKNFELYKYVLFSSCESLLFPPKETTLGILRIFATMHANKLPIYGSLHLTS